MATPSMLDGSERTYNTTPSTRSKYLDNDAAKFAYNPDDESIRHPHPHGKESYDHAGDMHEFIRRSHPERSKDEAGPKDTKNTDSAVPTIKSTNTAPVPVTGAADPAISKGNNPLIPIPFYCYVDGQLGSVDIYCAFVPNQLS